MNVCEGVIRLPTCGGSIPHPEAKSKENNSTNDAENQPENDPKNDPAAPTKKPRIYSSSSFDASVDFVPERSIKQRLRDAVRKVQQMNKVRKAFASNKDTNTDSESKVIKVKFTLFPIAATFPKGSRLRVQVCSGAFPRLSPNLGTGEPLSSACVGQLQHQEVFHTRVLRSCIRLPVVGGAGALLGSESNSAL